MSSSARVQNLLPAAARGAVAGALGVVAMTLSEKAEQSMTHRPNSYVPGRTLGTILGRAPGEHERPVLLNHLMHWGTGISLGALRGVWAAVGLRGPRANAAHAVVRLSFDQTMENTTGAGAPPHSWPVDEQLIDAGHKAVYACVTGLLADRLVQPALESRRGTTSH